MKHSRFYVGMLVILILLVVILGRKHFSSAMTELKSYKQLIKTEDVVQSDLQQNESAVENVRLAVLGSDYTFTRSGCIEALTKLLKDNKATFVNANALRIKNSNEDLFVCSFSEIPDIDKIPDSVNLLEITVSCKNVSNFATALESYKPLNVVVYPQNKQVTFCCLITDGGAAND